MNKFITALALSSVMLTSYAAPRQLTTESFAGFKENMVKRTLSTDRTWHNGTQEMTNSPTRVVTGTDGSIGPASYWGSLFTPEGEEWMYLAKFNEGSVGQYTSIISVDFTIYDSDFKEYKKFSAEFELGEGETSINSVQIAPTLTRKFFNINDAYEVMIYTHATTEDYTGREATYVYTLSDGSLVDRFEGNNIAAINTAENSWSENYTMVFMREHTSLGDLDENGYPQYSYMLYFDVYKKAGWGGGATLDHTFEVDYELISGSGDASLPILLNQHNGKIWYALPHYEKPYFLSQWSDDITPDNNFIIELYNSDFELVKTTTIPMALEGDAFFSFPGIGEFRGFDDLCFDYRAGDEPVYIIGVENYITNIDDFTTSLYIYDTDGNKLDTIIENVDDYLGLSNIEGCEEQWCFLFVDEENTRYKMIDFPSLNQAAEIPMIVEGTTVSTSLDRVPVGNGYKYVSSILTADADDAGNAIHKFLWLNADGSFDRFDRINLGSKVIMAQAYINASAFDPFLFNTDSHYEYMFLVKELQSSDSSRSDEYLRVISDNSEVLLNLGPNKETDERLNTIFLANLGTNKAKLIVTYFDTDYNYTIHHVDLPFGQFAGGDGSAENPYQISSPGDLLTLHVHPSAHYVLTNNIDFEGMPVHGNQCSFTGTIDGAGHTVFNLSLVNSSLLGEIYDNVTIKDLKFENVTMTINNSGSYGLIASDAVSGQSDHKQLENIVVNGLTVKGDTGATFGGLIGHAAVYTSIIDCSIVNADIDLPRGAAGGFIGEIATSSDVTNSFFEGKINAGVVGGIAAESFTGDEIISNCHVNADLTGSSTVGGIIGDSNRTHIDHCYVEGSLTVTSGTYPHLGGIVGYAKSTYEKDPPVMLTENIVAATITYNENAPMKAVHRIAGFTSIDDREIDWDKVDSSVDFSDPSTIPYLPGTLETCIKNNYAVGIDKIDSEVADDPDTTEGASLDAITSAFLTEHEWKLGSTTAAPWSLNDSGLKLWIEAEAYNAIVSIDSEKIATVVYDGESVRAEGLIEVFDTAGMLVAKGRGTVNVRHLPRGIYIARTATATAKFAK